MQAFLTLLRRRRDCFVIIVCLANIWLNNVDINSY